MDLFKRFPSVNIDIDQIYREETTFDESFDSMRQVGLVNGGTLVDRAVCSGRRR